MNDPFAEGYDAALAGKPQTSNPYDMDSEFDNYAIWNDGWDAFFDELDDCGSSP
jgi:hypothetical protein